MSETMQDNQNDNSQQEPAYDILDQEFIRLPGKKHYRVTLENINGCRAIVVWEITESNTNRRIIVPVSAHKTFLTYFIFFIGILKRIQLSIDDAHFYMDYTETIQTEDGRRYKFNFCLEDGNYYVKISQIENGDSVFITVDVASLEVIEEAIMSFHNHYRSLFHEYDPDGYGLNVETRSLPCCDLDISSDFDSDSYSDCDDPTFALYNSDSDS